MGSSIQTILKPGDVIGKYLVIRCLGIGGMGEVHLVRHQQLNAYRALKLLRTEGMTDNPVFVERFLREARIASRIQHPNTVSVLDVENDTVSGFCYIVMEYIDGSSLENVLRDGPLSQEQAVHIIAEVAKGLAAASELGLVHRDIKPSNIMISQDGQVKLSDLGIAKASDADVSVTLTMANSVMGTPAYASPEQCRSAHDVDVRADIYSLGATLYEMVTGQMPFEGANAFDIIAHVINDEPLRPRLLNSKISEELEKLILMMMAKDPQQRPQNIPELQQLLKPFLPAATAIPPELKNLIHERVEREVQARTSTVITAYRKKQIWERVIMLTVMLLLLISIFATFFRISRAHQQISQLKAALTQSQEIIDRQRLQSRSSQELRRLKTAEILHRTEKEEFEAQIASLKSQLERQRQNHEKSRAELERQISGLNTEIKRLKNIVPKRSDTEPQQSIQPAQAVSPPETYTTVKTQDHGLNQPFPSKQSDRSQFNPSRPNREEIRKIELAVSQKLIQAKPMIRGKQWELISAMKHLDWAEIQEFFRRSNLSFEELSYLRSWNILPESGILSKAGPVLGAAIGYNLDSPNWDTGKIHAFLTNCCRAGYRIDFFLLTRNNFLTHEASRIPSKWNRNYLDVLDFLLSRPDWIHFPPSFSDSSKGSVKQRILLNLSFARFATSPDFPGWLERIVRKGQLNLPEPASSGLSLLDRTYLHFYLLDSLTPAHLQCLENLERSGARYTLLNESDRKLIAAIRESNPKKVERLIREEGANPRKSYSFWGNALNIASSSTIKYNPEIILLLIKSGSPVRVERLLRRSPLAAAVEHNDAVLIRELLQRGAGLTDYYALQAACRRGNTEIAEMLLKNGTKPGRTVITAGTAGGGKSRTYTNDLLFDVLERKNSRIAILLIEKNIDLKHPRNGKTPLQIAEQDPDLKKVAELIRRKIGSSDQIQNAAGRPAEMTFAELAKLSESNIPDLSKWIPAPPPGWHIHFGKACREARRTGKMLLIVQYRPRVLPVFMKSGSSFRFIGKHFVPLLYYYPPDPAAPQEQIQHVYDIGKAAGMMKGLPQTRIFRPDGTLVFEFRGFLYHSEGIFMDILNDVTLGKTPDLQAVLKKRNEKKTRKR